MGLSQAMVFLVFALGDSSPWIAGAGARRRLPEEPGVELQSAAVVDAATLPPFTNQRGCARCGARYEIRVHFDRDCELVRGDHFHRVCSCGHRWLERCSEGVLPPDGGLE